MICRKMYSIIIVVFLARMTEAHRCQGQFCSNSMDNSLKRSWKGKSILERKAELLYWNLNNNMLPNIEIDKDILHKATLQSKKACAQIFKYEPWNCTFTKESFRKTSRETGLLYASLTSSVADIISRECARGRALKGICGECDPNWPTYGCRHDPQSASFHTKKFFFLTTNKNHLHQKVLMHNALVGLKIFEATITKKCKCHGISGSCTSLTCWESPLSYLAVFAHIKIKYELAQKWHFTNKFNQNENQQSPYIGYIDKSDNFCQNTEGRICNSKKNCEIICCGKNYTAKIIKNQQPCQCRWKDNYKLTCCTCFQFDNEYICH